MEKARSKSKTLVLILFVIALLVAVTGMVLRSTINNSTSPASTDETSDFVEEQSSNLPEDFPVFPGAELESSYDSKGDGVEAISVIWIAQGSLKEISDFYREGLQSRGWEVESVLEDEESVTFSFERGDSFGFVGLGKQDGESVIISVTIGARFERPTI
jgi:hypothetical protein